MKKQTLTPLLLATLLLTALGHDALSATPSNAPAGAAATPAAYWTMDRISDGVVEDQTGSHNATIPKLAAQKDPKSGEILPDFNPATEPGIKGNALLLKGEEQGFLDVANPKSFDFSGGMTVSAWIKVDRASALMNILSCAEDTPNPPCGWTLAYSYGTAVFRAVDDTGNLVLLNSPENSVAPGAWVHLAAVADATVIRLYINGAEVAAKPFAGPIKRGDTPLVIGNHATISGWRHFECPAFSGLIDEVKIFEQPLGAAAITAESDQALSGK
jgi:hypothetical protein